MQELCPHYFPESLTFQMLPFARCSRKLGSRRLNPGLHVIWSYLAMASPFPIMLTEAVCEGLRIKGG